MDQLSAHLDRGWDLVQKGDLRGARASARRAVESDKNSPEAHNLLGYVAAQEGDADEALEHYRQAMALDDGYIDPMLNAAEVLIHPLHEYDEAVALCDEVLEFVEAKEEVADALLLKFDALLAKGDRDAAKRVLDALPEGPFEAASHAFLIGRALFEVGEIERAEPHILAAVKADPRNADAHYYAGLLFDDKGDTRGAALAFLEAREIDLRAEPPPWSPSKDAFQKTVEKAVQALEPDLLKHLESGLVLVADVPGMELVADGVDPRTPVLLDGVRRSDEPGALAARVFVYQRNIERGCGGLEQLEEEVSFQLAEEIKHALEQRDGEERSADGKVVSRAPGEGGRARERERERERAEREKSTDSDESKPAARTRKA